MSRIPQFKVEFIDPETMSVVEDTDSIGLLLEDGILRAFYFEDEYTEDSKELIIRTVE